MAIKKLFKVPNNISLKGSLHLPGDFSFGNGTNHFINFRKKGVFSGHRLKQTAYR